MSEWAVQLQEVGKEYRLGTRPAAPSFWALRRMTFDVPQGSSLGVVGRNGAGKSTLLKLLAGITAPTEGRIGIRGRLAALIEVGSGFHPELTGRENVFLSGAILGMKRRELSAKLASIVEFAGVERFIDTPVKWYSSGMYVRLGFSIAAHLDPDVLLVDEVLAVGDAEFQVKCLTRIRELKRRGVTIVFISHDLTAVERLCDGAVLIDKGEVVSSGRPGNVVADYHRQLTSAETARGDFPALAREGAVRITGLSFVGSSGGELPRTGAPLTVSVRYAATRAVRNLIVELNYYSGDGKTLIATASAGDSSDGADSADGVGGADPIEVRAPGGCVEFTCDALPLRPDTYYLGAVVRDASTRHVVDWWDGGTMLHVTSGPSVSGQFFVLHSWCVRHDRQFQQALVP